MGFCKCTSKLSLCALSVLLWVAAVALIVIGVVMYSSYNTYSEITSADHILAPATIVIAVGIFLLLLGIVGCVGAFKEQKCLLGIFATVLLLIFIGTVASACLAFFYRGDINRLVKKGISKAIQQYNENHTSLEEEFDLLQRSLRCCGVESYNDWKDTAWYRGHEKTNKTVLYPESCCDDGVCDYDEIPANDTALNKQGCHKVLKNEVLSHLDVVAYVAAVFAIIQLLGMVSSCALICRRRKEVPYIGFNNPDGMRV